MDMPGTREEECRQRFRACSCGPSAHYSVPCRDVERWLAELRGMHRRDVEKAHAIATLCGQVNALRERIDRDELVRALWERARSYCKEPPFEKLTVDGLGEGDLSASEVAWGVIVRVMQEIEAGTFPPKHIEGVDRSPKHIEEPGHFHYVDVDASVRPREIRRDPERKTCPKCGNRAEDSTGVPGIWFVCRDCSLMFFAPREWDR